MLFHDPRGERSGPTHPYTGRADVAPGQQVAQHREMHRRAVELGMRPLYEDGLRKVVRGVTSLEEVLRVTRDV